MGMRDVKITLIWMILFEIDLRTDGASGCGIQKSDQFLQVVGLGDDDTLGGRHCNPSQTVDIGQIFLPVDLHIVAR